MIHANHKSSAAVKYSGRFFLATVQSDDGSALTLNTLPSKFFNGISLIDYAVQIVSIPQFINFKLSITNEATPKYDGAQGGIFAVAVSDTCDLRDGKISVWDKGGGKAYDRAGLSVIGNAQNCDKLPIGQGNGSVFILAKNIVMDANTAIGVHSSGTSYGRRGGYRGGVPASQSLVIEQCGCGGGGGQVRSEANGGYGSNSVSISTYNGLRYGLQGAHIMIVADKITGFNRKAIVTGGTGSTASDDGKTLTYRLASTGYGGAGLQGGGGYNGGGAGKGGGGSSGWAFIYCNEAVNQNTTDTVLFD